MKVFKLLVSLFSSFLPIQRSLILFKSFSGQYSDSPKALSEYIHEKYPRVHIAWVQSTANKDPFPEYVDIVLPDSLKYYIYIWKASVIVDNVSSVRSSWIHKKDNCFKKILLKYYTRKRKNQLSLSTWHGVPLKKIGMDNISFSKDCYLSTNCNFVLSGNEYTQKCLESSLGNSIPVVLSGIPRNDKLINAADDISLIKQKLGIPENKKVFLYAPTFRNDIKVSGVMQMQNIDFHELFSTLNKRFSGEWCFVFRTHMHVAKEIKRIGLLQSLGDDIIDGNVHDDMADYLKCADVLLTDYSSSMFDFIFTKRPCFLYVPDIDDYEKKERGFYIDFSSLPFDSSKSISGLYECICNFDEKDYLQKCSGFLDFLGNVDDGNATSRVAEEIISILDGKKRIDGFMNFQRTVSNG